ncbi:MAG: hypothetical protein ACE5IT_08970 [bacterium]
MILEKATKNGAVFFPIPLIKFRYANYGESWRKEEIFGEPVEWQRV